MNPKTTIAALKPEMRILVAATDGRTTLARSESGARVATVTSEPIKVARRVKVSTDLGDVEASPTARVLLAPAVDEPEWEEPTAQPEPPAPLIAVVTVDTAGRLTIESTVTVEDKTARIPERLDHAFYGYAVRAASSRIRFALDSIGYRQASQWEDHGQGTVAARVEQVDKDQ